MSHELSESTQFYLDTCERVSTQRAELFTLMERTIFRCYIFGCDVDNGGLSGFFYNISRAADVADDTVKALEAIGAPLSAELLRSAAVLVGRSDMTTEFETWGDYLAVVDPENRLEILSKQFWQVDEDVFELLEDYVVSHREDLSGS